MDLIHTDSSGQLLHLPIPGPARRELSPPSRRLSELLLKAGGEVAQLPPSRLYKPFPMSDPTEGGWFLGLNAWFDARWERALPPRWWPPARHDWVRCEMSLECH